MSLDRVYRFDRIRRGRCLREQLFNHILSLHIGYPTVMGKYLLVERSQPDPVVRRRSDHDVEPLDDHRRLGDPLRHRLEIGVDRAGTIALRQHRGPSVSHSIHSACSACTASTAEWIECENRRPAMLTKGNGASAINANFQSVTKRIAAAAAMMASREVRHRDRDHDDERLDLVEIARRAAHQLPGLGPVVVADVQRQDVVEQLLAVGIGSIVYGQTD